jgi:hypothetical protein
MIVSRREIAKKLEDIFKEINNSEYHVNPFFRISKGTPEQMKKYQVINSKFPRSIILIHFLISIPVNAVKLFIYLICSVIFFHQYRTFKYETQKSNILFLSHAIGENITKTDGDQFFALIPEHFHKKNQKVSILYTNHNLIGYHKNSKSLKLKSGEIDRYLIPKFLKPTENINYLRLIIPASFCCFFNGLQKLLSNPIVSILLIKSSIAFYSRSTYSNYLVGQRVQTYCNKNDLNILILTFEGHSYEQYIIEKIGKSQPKLSFIMYQHSPIVIDQFGVEHFLKTNTRSLTVLTTGSLYEKVFKSFSMVPSYLILGSSKADTNFIDTTDNLKIQILFAPEGTTVATLSFLRLINSLCSMNPELFFSLRLHPNLKRNLFVNSLIKKLGKKSNFSLSSDTLFEDLKKSQIVFYRSSAVGVQALMSQAIPIFYSDSKDLGLNVLGNQSTLFPVVANLQDAMRYLKSEPPYVSKNERMRLFEENFSKINYEKINTLLRF